MGKRDARARWKERAKESKVRWREVKRGEGTEEEKVRHTHSGGYLLLFLFLFLHGLQPKSPLVHRHFKHLHTGRKRKSICRCPAGGKGMPVCLHAPVCNCCRMAQVTREEGSGQNKSWAFGQRVLANQHLSRDSKEYPHALSSAFFGNERQTTLTQPAHSHPSSTHTHTHTPHPWPTLRLLPR